MNADEVVGDRPFPAGPLQGQEVVACRLVRAFREVQDHLRVTGDLRKERIGVIGRHIGDAGPGVGQFRVAGLFHVADQAPVEPDDRW